MSYCGMKWLMVVCTSLALSFLCGQSPIWTNPITGTNPNTSNPYTAGDVVDMNVTVSGIGRGSGISGSNANDRYNARGWTSTSLDAGDYFSFTLTPKNGYKIIFASFVYSGQTSGTGPTAFSFRTSIDGYMSSLGSATSTGTTIDLTSIAEVKYPNYVEFRIYAWGATDPLGTFSVNDFAFNATVVLPIELLSFTHKIEQHKIHLLWSTATELNNDYMAIERSVDGQNFSEIGRIPGAGNSLERIDYSFIDRFPYQGTNYYRLRQVDYDGSITYHKVIAVDFNGESENTLAINQSLEEVSVQFHSPNAAGQLVLVDAMGRIIRTQKIAEKVQSARINTNGLPKGFYVVQIHQKDGLTKAMPLIK